MKENGWKVRSLVGYQVEVLRTQNRGGILWGAAGCEVSTAPSSPRNGRLSFFGVKTGACEYGPINVVERRCLGWDPGVVKGFMLRFESQVG